MTDHPHTLIFTSFDDLRSALACARANGTPYSGTELSIARDLAESLGMKTKVKLLESEMRRAR